MELKRERFRDLSEGREKERSRDRSQGRERDNSRERWEKDKSQWKESAKDATREREFLKVRKDEEEKETDPPSGSVSPHVPCLRTIRADNIIIIEQDRKGSDDRKGIWREMERERPEEDHQVKRGMKMDLREILAGGGSVTEIRASEVLIIQPSANPEERNTGGKGREDGEMKCSLDMRRESRELRTDISWLREKEKERPWGQATVIKEGLKDSSDDNVFLERGGRVSQLLSKFGELPKPPSRSKSSDNFLRPGRRKYSDEDDQQSEERRADGRNMLLKGVPKRSFSFSDRVVCAKENGLGDESCYERKTRERTHSDKSVAPWLEVATQSPRGGSKHQVKDDFQTQEKDQSESNYKASPLRVCSPTSQLKQTITVNHSFLRTQSPDNSLRPSDCAPTPAPSPSSPSPTQSPSVSPSPSPSPTLFSIRRGGGGTGSTAGSTTSADSTPAKTPMQQAQVAPAAAEPMKKKYPTVEEIQVIGGYQNLEKSCLVKYRGTTKRVSGNCRVFIVQPFTQINAEEKAPKSIE
uniref:Phostensin/Taperin PP1-binding domain-containing protein n=1 Tax=Scophthalmus maximus TaxID=52904 RepID=A0A8D3BF51_SCOMX